ncbi:hypothetical protein HII31_07993 [Pseudocercospora fuligena]|uniref:Lysine-specific metallo-endopeptidase domain-containing protein n=1 Tax=Pseudocercospora fuligena TaxID=685502 RepID=A0A8H6RH15_9PEZI|nr:hypothetical protein HII31_07993 [Pseudocercospora fuligena]
MYLAAGILAAWSLSSVHAKPLPSPSQVVDKRADPPAPSAYPLGDACGNEWQYLNFNPDDDTDKSRLQKLHDVICKGELRALSSWGAAAAQDAKTSINEAYDLYFATENPDSRDVVYDVLMMIAGQSSTEGMIGEIVGTMIVDNLDFGADTNNQCDEDGNTLGYTVKDTLDKREKIHFCPAGFDLPTSGPDIDCSTLDTYPSEKMDTFSRLALHETLHYSTIGSDSSLGEQIIDAKNPGDLEYAYFPERTHGLIDDDQDDSPDLPPVNADSYAWMALTAWVGYNCSPEDEKDVYDSYFPDEPPHYM